LFEQAMGDANQSVVIVWQTFVADGFSVVKAA